MRSKHEILERLAKITGDTRLHAKPADVMINAPLALIQVALETEKECLRWILEEE